VFSKTECGLTVGHVRQCEPQSLGRSR